MNIEIANRLVDLRKRNNLSQEALAEKLGISRQAVSKWERAEASPDTDNLILLARIYGVSLDELLNTGDAIPMPGVADTEEPIVIVEEHKNIDYRFLRRFPLTLVIVLIYVCMGAIWGGWHPGWMLFFLPILWETAIKAIEKKDAKYFAYPVLMAFVYLCLGFFWSLWHPGWIIFFTIPLYYTLTGYFKRMFRGQGLEMDGIVWQTEEKKGRKC
jgi:transcriptional regulator with XRE-family HTH domain